MPQALDTLPKGYRFPPVTFELTEDWVREYIDSVEDQAIGAIGPDAVPPMAVAALSIRALLEQSGLPPGAVHVGQELTFHRPVSIGSRVTVEAEVASRGERQGCVLMSVDLAVKQADGFPIMTGRATVTFPLQPPVALA